MTPAKTAITAVPGERSSLYLIAEDNPADAELVKSLLQQAVGEEYSVLCVDRFDKLKDALARDTFEALILDMNLPDRSGIRNISDLGQQYPELPIVVLTGQDDLELAVQSLNKGAQDYLSKNHVTSELLSRSLRYARERKKIELRLKKALQQSAYRNAKLQTMAQHDALTTLPNRACFQTTAPRMLMRAARSKKWLSLLYFDLNGFKKINDSYGHLTGDELLRQVAIRLKSTVRESDFLARLGGDEFVVVTDLLDNKRQIYKLINRLQSVFHKPFNIAKHHILCTPSIGVAFYPDAENLQLLIKQADCAMYEAKAKANTSVCFYTSQLENQFTRTMEIESHLSEALRAAQFDVHFQQVFSPGQAQANHIEALLRWHSPQLGEVAPDEFMHIAENSPTINEITRFVVSKCGELLSLASAPDKADFKLAINICASQLSSASFCDQLIMWLEKYHIPAHSVCLELTERQMVDDSGECSAQSKRLRALGMQIALDDFGTGYSSFTHLLELPLDYLKLDRVLVKDIDSNTRNQALTAGIVEMAHRLGMKVVAEGIESKEEFDIACELGCDYLQGYYIARPMPITEFVSHAFAQAADKHLQAGA